MMPSTALRRLLTRSVWAYRPGLFTRSASSATATTAPLASAPADAKSEKLSPEIEKTVNAIIRSAVSDAAAGPISKGIDEQKAMLEAEDIVRGLHNEARAAVKRVYGGREGNQLLDDAEYRAVAASVITAFRFKKLDPPPKKPKHLSDVLPCVALSTLAGTLTYFKMDEATVCPKCKN